MAKTRRRKQKKRASGVPGAGLVWALLLFAVACGLYANTLGHEFVFDDTTLIAQNPDIRNFNWQRLVGFLSYRPFRNLTYALNYKLGGLEPFGYHLFNVLLHGFNALLVFLLLKRLTGSANGAGAGALVFAVHPAQSAAVAYVSGRKDLLATFFIVLGLICYLDFRRKRRKGLAVAALLAFVLGMLSKEVAIVIPALMLLVDLCLASRSVGSKQSPNRFGWIGRTKTLVYAVALSLAALALCYALFLARASRMEAYWGGSLSTHLGTSFKLFAHYLRLAVVPYPLIADYTGDVFPVSTGLTEWTTILAVFVLVGYLGLAASLYRRHPLITLGMTWFALCLAPVLQLIPFHELAADHFLYLPMVGPALLAGLAVRHLMRERSLEVLTWGVLVLVVIGASVMTIDRNRDWKDERTLWDATYEKAPGSYRANLNLGTLTHNEDWRRAVELTQRSIELKPAEALPYNNLGAIYRMRSALLYERGDVREAERVARLAMENIQRSIELYPHDPFAYSNLGDAYKMIGLIRRDRGEEPEARRLRQLALNNYLTTLSIAGDHPVAPLVRHKVAMVYIDAHDCKNALPYLTQAAAEMPSFQPSQFWAGACQMETGDYAAGARYLEKVLALGPDLSTFSHLATCYRELGDHQKAVQTMLRAVRQLPDSAEAHHNLGVLYYQQGNIERAKEQWQLALRLEPEGDIARRSRQFLADLIGGS